MRPILVLSPKSLVTTQMALRHRCVSVASACNACTCGRALQSRAGAPGAALGRERRRQRRSSARYLMTSRWPQAAAHINAVMPLAGWPVFEDIRMAAESSGGWRVKLTKLIGSPGCLHLSIIPMATNSKGRDHQASAERQNRSLNGEIKGCVTR